MTLQDELGISVTHNHTTAVVGVAGELDLATAPTLAEALRGLGAPCERVVLDLSELTFIDSTGLRLTVAEYERAKAEGFELVLAGATDDVLRVIRLTGLDVVVPMAPDVWSALDNGR
jgi:anti-anti-sigma factor